MAVIIMMAAAIVLQQLSVTNSVVKLCAFCVGLPGVILLDMGAAPADAT
jgi:hypothetical protein